MYPNNKTKAATALGVNLADPPSSLLGSVGSTPLKDVTNILIAYGNSAYMFFFVISSCTPLMLKSNPVVYCMQVIIKVDL